MRSVVLPATVKLGNYALCRSTDVIMGRRLHRQYYSCVFRQANVSDVKRLPVRWPTAVFQSF